jgi:hypothetical protein
VNLIVWGNVVRGDDKRHFEYEATTECSGRDMAWTARVTSDGRFAGRLSGMLRNADALHVDEIADQVRQLVELSIARDLGVECSRTSQSPVDST